MSVHIFFSYAHEDEQLRKGLELQLKGLARQDLVTMWHDRDISAGTEWEQSINTHLDTADIILLLVSPDFVASDYCYSIEVKRAKERHERKEAVVIPVILRPVHWQNTPFGKLQSLPSHAEYITSSRWGTIDEAFYNVAEGIRGIIEEMKKKPVTTSHKKIEGSSPNMKISLNNEDSRTHDIFTENFKRLCPACIEELYPGDCEIISRITREVLKPAPTGWMTKQLSRRNPELLTSPQYLSKQASRQCPHCGYLLPYNIESAENISIAVVGDVASGKSTYIASLIYLLEERWAKDNDKVIQVKCLTEDIREHFIYMIRSRQLLPLTQPCFGHSYNPLIYEIKIKESLKRSVKKINLILYDGSGEDQSSVMRIEHYARYVLYANAIIFLIDPLFIPHIYNRLPKSMQYSWIDDYTGKTYPLVNSTVELFKSYYGSRARDCLRSIPVSMMLSKSDILKYTVPVTSSYGFLSHCKYSECLDLQDRENIDKEVRAFIGNSSEHILLKVAQKFSKANFFATSATGCAANENGLYPFLDPCRCLDPLLWILYQLNVLRAK